MKKNIFIVFLSISWICPFNSFAHVQGETHMETILEDKTAVQEGAAEATPIENPMEMMNPVSILSNLMKESQETSPLNPDVNYLPDPGNPDAPVDAHIWFLLLLVAAFGAYQYKKQSTKTA